jgi:hypothetical protein
MQDGTSTSNNPRSRSSTSYRSTPRAKGPRCSSAWASVRCSCRGAPPEWLYSGAPDEATALAWAAAEGKKGRRTLAIAWKDVPAAQRTVGPDDERAMAPAGIVSFADPLKSTTRAAVQEAERLGVRVKIITGDSKDVAGWVGVETGLTDDAEAVLMGDEFERMTDEAKAVAVDRYDVFARTTPTQKFDIVRTLERTHLVGFLGEGFNDAPSDMRLPRAPVSGVQVHFGSVSASQVKPPP